jgi:hypothetical protein
MDSQPADELVVVCTQDKKLYWPPFCACCGAKADTERRIGIRKVKSGWSSTKVTTTTWPVPYCSNCALHIRPKRSITEILLMLVFLCAGFFAVGAVGLLFSNKLSVKSLLLLLFILLNALIAGVCTHYAMIARDKILKSLIGTTCSVSPERGGGAVGYIVDDGNYQTFRFLSPSYATAFRSANLLPGQEVNHGKR